MYKKRIFFLLSIALALGFVAFSGSTAYIIHREFSSTQNEYKTLVKTVSADLNYTMREIQRLSQILMLNSDIQYFVSHPPIEKGSANIQTLIDAQNHLASAKSVYPAVEAIYVYSKNSDYLLEAANVFFSIDQMYSPLFAFDGLNSGQWRSTYLLPVYINHWFARTDALVNGTPRDVIPFVQTLPLTNPSANSGKLIILCKTVFFDDIVKSLAEYSNSFTYIFDSEGEIIYSNGSLPTQKITGNGNQRVNGKMHQVVVESLDFLGYSLVSVVPWATLFYGINLLQVLILAACAVAFFIGALWAIVRFRSQYKNEQISFAENQIANTDFSHRIDENADEKDTVFFERIEAYMKDNYQNPLLNLSQMAQDFGTKESFLYHFFITKINESFSHYLENYRLQQARCAIETDMTTTITELAENCGYANSQTFRRAFKKKFGLTPSDYKTKVFCKS